MVAPRLLFKLSHMVGHNIGQNDADGQYGTTSVPTAEHAWAWRITLGIRLMGGHHQLFSPAQLTVNVSMASEPGFQFSVCSVVYAEAMHAIWAAPPEASAL